MSKILSVSVQWAVDPKERSRFIVEVDKEPEFAFWYMRFNSILAVDGDVADWKHVVPAPADFAHAQAADRRLVVGSGWQAVPVVKKTFRLADDLDIEVQLAAASSDDPGQTLRELDQLMRAEDILVAECEVRVVGSEGSPIASSVAQLAKGVLENALIAWVKAHPDCGFGIARVQDVHTKNNRPFLEPIRGDNELMPAGLRNHLTIKGYPVRLTIPDHEVYRVAINEVQRRWIIQGLRLGVDQRNGAGYDVRTDNIGTIEDLIKMMEDMPVDNAPGVHHGLTL